MVKVARVWYGIAGSFETVAFPGAPPRASTVLSLAGLILSGVVVVLFVADLAAAFPFQRVSVAADIGFILAGLLVGYLSWSINSRAKA
jgi:hypothetical protein